MDGVKNTNLVNVVGVILFSINNTKFKTMYFSSFIHGEWKTWEVVHDMLVILLLISEQILIRIGNLYYSMTTCRKG